MFGIWIYSTNWHSTWVLALMNYINLIDSKVVPYSWMKLVFSTQFYKPCNLRTMKKL